MKLLPLVTFMLFLSACSNGVEMPADPTGTDEMRISPCACAQIDYEPAGFEWSNA